MEELLLPVGTCFEFDRAPPRVRIWGELLARVRGLPLVLAPADPRGLRIQSRSLYRGPGPFPFLVHVSEEFPEEPAHTVARLERYRTWAEMAEEHPDLAARAPRALQRPPVLEIVPSPPAELERVAVA